MSQRIGGGFALLEGGPLARGGGNIWPSYCRFKRILVLISHSQDFLNGVCTNIIHLHNRKLKYYTVSGGRRGADSCLTGSSRSQALPSRKGGEEGPISGHGTPNASSSLQGNYDQYVKTRVELEENQMKRFHWEQDQIAHMKVTGPAPSQAQEFWGSSRLCPGGLRSIKEPFASL